VVDSLRPPGRRSCPPPADRGRRPRRTKSAGATAGRRQRTGRRRAKRALEDVRNFQGRKESFHQAVWVLPMLRRVHGPLTIAAAKRAWRSLRQPHRAGVDVQRVPVGRTLLIAGVSALLPLGGNVVASFLTEWSGGGSWLAVPAVGVGVAMLTAVVEAYGSATEPSPSFESRDPEHRPGDTVLPQKGNEQLRKPLAEVLLIAVLVLGLGGWAVTEAVRHGVESITGNTPTTEEPGTEQLRNPVTGHAGRLYLTVESVKRSADYTSVRLAARNETGSPLTLPSGPPCLFVGIDGTTLTAFPFAGDWSDEVAPGTQRGTVVFMGHLPDSVRRASLSFTTIYGASGPDSVTVPNIMLK
jgi:hypothetical protein